MHRKLIFLFIGLFLLSTDQNTFCQKVKVYPYYVQPTDYSDYSRRPFKTPTWKTFKDTVQFVGGRSWGSSFGVIDEKAPYWLEGAKVMRPNFLDFKMNEDSLQKALLRMNEKGFYLFNINAYGPGTPLDGGFGQFEVAPWKSKMMASILQDRFLGFDLGEQDGRYWADSRSIDFPLSPNYSDRYLNAMKYMHQAAKDQGDIISLLSVKWFWHYPIKDGFITLSGAESQNKTFTSNDQVHYAFLRGASKQYGTLWYGDISVFNSWGWKTYGTENNINTGPTKGNSISWMKRMLLSQYQYNCTILGFEGSKFYKKSDDGSHKISPIGQLQTDMQDFVKQIPKPGPQHTPVAFLQDFFSGWMTPSEPFPDKFKVWNFLPYKKDDFFMHNLLKMFYVDYEQAGLHKNEYAGLCSNPYGDGLDILLSDVRLSTLARYQVVVVSSELKTNLPEIADKLKSYVQLGGHLVITSDNARNLFPELDLNGASNTIILQEIKIEKGKMSVIHCNEMGIEKDNQLDFKVKGFLDTIFKSTRVFSVGDSLGYITNIEGKGKYLIGIYNHNLRSMPFKIKSHVGKIKNVEELYPITNLTKKPGYYPEGFEDTEPGLSDDRNISAGDVRLFVVEISDVNVEYLPELKPEKRVFNKYVSVSSLIGLKERLQVSPTFFDYFSGIKINWREILKIDKLKFKEDAWWYNLKHLQIAVEFDLDFINQNKNGESILPVMIEKLANLEHINMLLFSENFPAQMKKVIKESFPGALIFPDSSISVIVANNGKTIFPKDEQMPVIINQDMESWDKLYPAAKSMYKGETYQTQPGGYKKELPKSLALTVKPENANYFFSHHDISKDIYDLLGGNAGYLENFGGIKLDGSYLFFRSIEKCKEEARLLKKTGLKVIIDLCREINNYPNLTWLSEIGPAYTRSIEIHDNILSKMKAMGIKNVIIGSHMRPEKWRKDFKRSPEESITAGISAFINKADKLGITVSVQNRMYEHYPSRLLAKPGEVVDLVSFLSREYKNIKLAAHLGLVKAPKELIGKFGDNMNICIVAAKGSDDFDYRIPLLSGHNNKFKINRNVMLVFDADYSSLVDLLEDKQSIQLNHLK